MFERLHPGGAPRLQLCQLPHDGLPAPLAGLLVLLRGGFVKLTEVFLDVLLCQFHELFLYLGYVFSPAFAGLAVLLVQNLRECRRDPSPLPMFVLVSGPEIGDEKLNFLRRGSLYG